MILDIKKPKPDHLADAERLIIDRKSVATQVVCLELDQTLIYQTSRSYPHHYDTTPTQPAWLKNGIDITFDKHDKHDYVIIPRPGLTELLAELSHHAMPVIYSTATKEYVSTVMHYLSVSHDSDGPLGTSSDAEEAAFSCWHMPQWAREQCIQTTHGLKKSLGHFCAENTLQINQVWIVDNRPDLVDFPSRAIQVPPFYGNPYDRALYELIDNIFIN